MSSKEAEFISQWNDLLEFKIDENSLRRPTFQFFYGALECLLRKLNFNIESAKNEAVNNIDAERLYFVRFCAFVQRLYNADQSFNFFYLDLINPTSKKSCHVLKMLFNYLKYYEMVKQTVCKNANDALQMYDEALANNQSLQIKNETAKTRAANMERQLCEYEKKLPLIQERVNNCLADVQSLDKEIAQKNTDIKNFDSTIIKVEIQQTELSESLVSEEEYKKRIDLINTLKQQLNDLREVAEHVRTSNVGSSQRINELSQTLETVNKALEQQKLAHYDELILIDSNLDLTDKAIKREEQQIMELKTKLKALIENKDNILSKIKQIEAYVDKVQTNSDELTEELIRTISYNDKNIEAANSELTEVKFRIEELQHQQHFILTSIVTILRTLTSPSNYLGKSI
ncbi:kinetochore protein Nuf2-B [Contarinia nasturtii]|uniref:kinetochore protein Nuf2-B n=1 Tax=Contarinia nasturtii TaxID=265458 RepID=UPI0012D3FC0A|nr:kinetochore protein Nuf2-B [Contarinia nasturtii]